MTHPTWCIAHRGAREEAPENSMSALRRALAYPVDGIEFDVQMSRDGMLLLYHDATLEKVGGGDKRVADMTVDELARMDWGSWFHVDFKDEPMTTFEEALSLLDRTPHMFIEVKSHPSEQASGHPYRLTEQMIEIIERPEFKKYHERIAILSFDPEVLSRAYHLAPHLRYVFNRPHTTDPLTDDETRHLWAVDLNIDTLDGDLADQARILDLRLFTYTCNTEQQVAKAMRRGVDGIISDKPGWLIEQIKATAFPS